MRKLNLPMFVPDPAVEGYPAAHQGGVKQLIEACCRTEIMIWASATYHGTISGALKNALDFLELLADDQPPYLQGCAVGLIAVHDPITFDAMINAVHELRAWLAPT